MFGVLFLPPSEPIFFSNLATSNNLEEDIAAHIYPTDPKGNRSAPRDHILAFLNEADLFHAGSVLLEPALVYLTLLHPLHASSGGGMLMIAVSLLRCYHQPLGGQPRLLQG